MLTDDLKKATAELAEHRQRLLAVSKLLHFHPGVELHHAATVIARELHNTARGLEEATNQLELKIPGSEKPTHK